MTVRSHPSAEPGFAGSTRASTAPPNRGVWLAALLLVATAACRSGGCDADDKPAARAKRSPPRPVGPPVAPPASVLATLGLDAPGRSIDAALQLVKRFVDLPLTRDALVDQLLQRARMHRDLLEVLDLDGTAWIVLLDDQRLHQRDAAVLVLPLRSRDEFLSAWKRRMKRTGREGDLTVYRPRAGEIGLTETRLWLSAHHVVVPSSREAFNAAKAYVRRTLLRRKPRAAAELELMVPNLIDRPGAKLDAALERAIARMRRRAGSDPSAPLKRSLAESLAGSLRSYAALFKSASRVVLAADVDRAGVELRIEAIPRADGALRRAIEQMQPGRPMATHLLPAHSWLVLAQRASRGSSPTASPAQLLLEAVATAMDRKHGESFREAVRHTAKQLSGDYTLALHATERAPHVGASLVARVDDAEAARASIERALRVFGHWASAQGAAAVRSGKAKRGARRPRPEVRSRKLRIGSARGRLYSIELPAATAGLQRVEQLLPGRTRTERADRASRSRRHAQTISLSGGWIVAGGMAAATLGGDAAARLRAIAKRAGSPRASASTSAKGDGATPKAQTLADDPAFARATRRSGRIGWLYLSLLDLVPVIGALGSPAARAAGATMRGKRVEVAPVLDWGVDDDRGRFDFTLRIPAAHFEPFRPLLEALQRDALP